MLVHVTRFNKVQSVVYENIDAYIQDVRQRLTRRIGHEPFLHQLESLWQADFFADESGDPRSYAAAGSGRRLRMAGDRRQAVYRDRKRVGTNDKRNGEGCA